MHLPKGVFIKAAKRGTKAADKNNMRTMDWNMHYMSCGWSSHAIDRYNVPVGSSQVYLLLGEVTECKEPGTAVNCADSWHFALGLKIESSAYNSEMTGKCWSSKATMGDIWMPVFQFRACRVRPRDLLHAEVLQIKGLPIPPKVKIYKTRDRVGMGFIV